MTPLYMFRATDELHWSHEFLASTPEQLREALEAGLLAYANKSKREIDAWLADQKRRSHSPAQEAAQRRSAAGARRIVARENLYLHMLEYNDHGGEWVRPPGRATRVTLESMSGVRKERLAVIHAPFAVVNGDIVSDETLAGMFEMFMQSQQAYGNIEPDGLAYGQEALDQYAAACFLELPAYNRMQMEIEAGAACVTWRLAIRLWDPVPRPATRYLLQLGQVSLRCEVDA